jgi:acetolactate synthase I/II/III large subunit
VHDVRAVVPEDGIVCLDNGMYKIWFARNYRTRVANTLLLDNALATMGAGLASAMMAKLLNPHLPVLAVCGDGGFMMNSQELETAVRLKLDLVVLIVVDGAYGMIRWKQAVQYAAAYGAHGHRVGSAEALAPTLRGAFAAGGVHLVAVPVDYRENFRVLVEELGRRERQVSGAT